MTNETDVRTPEEQALLDAAAGPAQADEIAPPTQIEAPPAPPELPELSYAYQPKDESGRPIGGKQVLKYKTPDELADKLRDQNELLIRKLREQTRKNRLGIQELDTIEQSAAKFEAPLELKPRTLSPEERYKIAREINDPDTFDQAADALLEARLGAKPEVFAKTVSDLQLESMRAKAVAESEAFMRENPDFVRCQENGEAITSWIVRYNLAPVRANYQKAYDALKAAGVLVVTEQVTPTPEPEPVVPEPVEVAPEPVVETPPAHVEQTPPARVVTTPARIPSGLTRGQATDVGTVRTVGDDIVYEIVMPQGGKKRFTGLAAINAMPSEEYKRRLSQERGFREKAEALETAAAAKRQYVRR